jgi:pilus assembly protein CpaC
MKQAQQIKKSAGVMFFGFLLVTAASWGLPDQARAQVLAKALTQKTVVTKGNAPAVSAVAPVGSSSDFATVGPMLDLVVGKSTLLRIPTPIERISVGNPNIADISLISPVELYLLGKNYGSTNLVIWRKGGTVAIDVNVSIDSERMERKLRELLPEEKGIRVRPAADSVILTGIVSSGVKAKQAEDIANAFVRDINHGLVLPVTAGDTKVQTGSTLSVGSGTGGGSAKVVNLLQVVQGQQVMLEVKVAEVSKTLLDKLGVDFKASAGNGGVTYNILSSLLASTAGQLFSITGENGNKLTLDANKTDGLFKVLAEPNIISISGQEASFLAGGKIFIPVVSSSGSGSFITLEEKEFGVGLKFTPTVLDGGRIHLKVAPEVSELGRTITIGNGGSAASLPSFTTRRVQTTVQLMDGQSLAIAGLIKNNVTESISRVPLLGDIPILGALFRSSEFQNDRSELVFLITPHLVKPLAGTPVLPTDNFIVPSRTEFFLGGKLEGGAAQAASPDQPANATPQRPAPQAQPGGFELK